MKHKIKITFAFLMAIMVFCCLFLSGCHQHNYSKTVVQPTCTERGYTKYTCTTCGNSYQENYVAALGHHYTETKINATCVQKGYALYKCTRCNNSYHDNETSSYGNHVGVGKCAQCGADFFELLKKHCINYGSLESDDLYMIILDPIQYDGTKFIPVFSYDAELNKLQWLLQTSSSTMTASFMITIDQIDGTYSYILDTKSSMSVTMMGNFNASSLSKLTSLPYTLSTTSIASLNSTLSQMACSMAQLIVPTADIYYAKNGLKITSANLGFN